VLTSALKTRGTDNAAAFDFQTALTTPPGCVAMVNVEGFFGVAPSLFHQDYMSSGLNVFTSNTFGNEWSLEFMMGVFLRCHFEDMSNVENVLGLILDVLDYFEGNVYVRFPQLSHADAESAVEVRYVPAVLPGGNHTYEVNGITSGETWAETKAKLEMYLSRMTQVRGGFCMEEDAAMSYTCKGPWLLSLGLSPYTSYTFEVGSPLAFTIQTQGISFMNVNCGVAHSVMVTQTSDMRLTQSDVVWSIPSLLHQETGCFTSISTVEEKCPVPILSLNHWKCISQTSTIFLCWDSQTGQ
jgi:hypothetical protein